MTTSHALRWTYCLLAGWFVVLAVGLAILTQDIAAGVFSLALLAVSYAIGVLWSLAQGYTDTGTPPSARVTARVWRALAWTASSLFVALFLVVIGSPPSLSLPVLALSGALGLLSGGPALRAATTT